MEHLLTFESFNVELNFRNHNENMILLDDSQMFAFCETYKTTLYNTLLVLKIQIILHALIYFW